MNILIYFQSHGPAEKSVQFGGWEDENVVVEMSESSSKCGYPAVVYNYAYVFKVNKKIPKVIFSINEKRNKKRVEIINHDPSEIQKFIDANEMSRINIPTREHGYSNLQNVVIRSTTELKEYVQSIANQSAWNDKAEFVNASYKMNKSTLLQ